MDYAYLDYLANIDAQHGDGYPVSVRSPAGEAKALLRLPFDAEGLQARLKTLALALQASPTYSSGKEVCTFGQELFDALLTGDVRSLYYESQREAEHQQQGLRIKLTFQPPELAVLPWEYLYDARIGEYICLSRNTPLVRYINLAQPVQPLTVAPPLRILGVAVSPKDLPALDLLREKQRLEQGLDVLQNRVKLTWLSEPTWQNLLQTIRNGPWHILHFIGHGGFDPVAREGLVMLADEQGCMHQLTATQVGRMLADQRDLRLVVLNACEGARSSEFDVFSSTATTLLRRGIPAVLAMQYAITDRAAIVFSQAFYAAMADSLPIDSAVAEARKAISFAIPNTIEWGTPVLYTRAPDGRILDIAATTKTSGAINTQEALVKQAEEQTIRMESTQIIAAVMGYLVPYLSEAGKAVATKAGEEVWEKAKQIHASIKERFTQEKDSYVTQVLERFEQQPEVRKAAFQEVLGEILKKDTQFAQTLIRMLQTADLAASDAVFNTQLHNSQVDEIFNIKTLQGGLTINKGK